MWSLSSLSTRLPWSRYSAMSVSLTGPRLVPSVSMSSAPVPVRLAGAVNLNHAMSLGPAMGLVALTQVPSVGTVSSVEISSGVPVGAVVVQ